MTEKYKGTLTFANAGKICGNFIKIFDGILFVPEIYVESCGGYVMNEDVFISGIVTKGSIEMVIKNISHQLNAGDIMLLFPGDTIDCKFKSEDAKGSLFICSVNRTLDLVKDTYLYRYMFKLRNDQVITLPESNYHNIAEYTSLIRRKISSDEITPLSSQTLLHLVQASISELNEGLQALGYEHHIEKISSVEKLYKEFIMLLSTIPIHPREVEWYAGQLNITPKYLSKICRDKSNRCASEWIKEYCMLDIKCHLMDSSLSLKEIANKLGYSSLSFFGKNVKRWFGITPTELRNTLCDNKHIKY
ncbi:MAG: AraC family transcriptional regulator [Bacteroides sp.]|nr:AraC family transcriptional regulator [Bacteroides sp.]